MATPWFSLRRDGIVLIVLVLVLLMLWAGLTGSARTFAFSLTALIGTLVAVGFVRDGRPRTWVPPIVATLVLAVSFAGMFAHEADVVSSARDTWLGFHPATAYLVYGLWIPAFFTLAVSFAWLFDEVSDAPARSADDGEVDR